MGEFFLGWRTRVGVVTLLIACAFSAFWIRGHFVRDVATYTHVDGYETFSNCCYGLKLFRFKSDDTTVRFGNDLQVSHHPGGSANGPHPADFHFTAENDVIISHWQKFGFHTGETVGTINRLRMTLWVIPHWSLVLPLAALSAFLLLWKPRPNKRREFEPLL